MIRRHRRPAAGAARRQRSGEERRHQRDEAAADARRRPRHPVRPAPSHDRLSPAAAAGTSRAVSAPDIFDRHARRRRRDRAAAGDYPAYAFLRDVMVEGLLERRDAVTRAFTDVLDIGTPDLGLTLPGAHIARLDAGFGFARAAGGVQGEEDRLPFADASFDAVFSAGVLDQVNDLPGALTLIRRVLRPDGLFLGAFLGGGSLPALRAALRVAEGDRPAARLHPQVDVRSAGDLLMRAGFALPVADIETFEVRYSDFGRLLDDLRGMAASNILIDRTAMTRDTLARAAAAFAAAAGPDGRTTERFSIVYLTGWAPDPSQPKPARRGSATSSLAAALQVRTDRRSD